MVRLSLMILTLLGMFILNACGNNNLQRPANIDDQEAVLYKKGIVSGRATPTVAKILNDNNEVENKEEKHIFEEVDIYANFDRKKVSLKAKTLNSDNVMEEVLYEGEFDETGFALLSPKNTKIKTKAVIRCVESCDSLIADVGIKHLVDGTQQYESEQFELKDNKVTRKAKRVDIFAEDFREIDLVSSHLADAPILLMAPVKKNEPKKVNPKKPEIIPPLVIPKDEDNTEVDTDDEDSEMEEPAIDSGKYQDFMDEKLLDSTDMKSVLNAFSLGDKYPGQAKGFYSNGSLQKGTDIISNVKTLLLPGFKSVAREKSHMYYGSGFLIKMLEEIGSMYAKAFAGQAFEVSAVSKKAGGPNGHKSHENGLDADIPLPKNSKSQVDFGKIWFLVKSFYFEENKVKATIPDDKPIKNAIGIMILSPIKMKELCTYLKKNNEKNISGPFSKLYQDVLSYKRVKKGRKTIKIAYYPHENHIHMRAMCTPHNKSCRPAYMSSYTKSKFGVCQ